MIVLGSQESSSLSIVDPTIKGLQTLKLRKADSRVNRITALLMDKATLSSARQKELASLLKCDTYDPDSFSESHRLFKVNHNDVFAALGTTIVLTLNRDVIFRSFCQRLLL
jgi:hypothetical protein